MDGLEFPRAVFFLFKNHCRCNKMQVVHDQGSCLLKYQIENWKKEIGKRVSFFSFLSSSFSFFLMCYYWLLTSRSGPGRINQWDKAIITQQLMCMQPFLFMQFPLHQFKACLGRLCNSCPANFILLQLQHFRYPLRACHFYFLFEKS